MVSAKLTELISELLKLEIHPEHYAIFGSGPMDVSGLREVRDLDVLVMPEDWEELGQKYTKVKYDCIQVWSISLYPFWLPDVGTTTELISTAEIIEGIRYVTLEKVLAFKEKRGKEKDRADILLIRDYLKNR